MPRAGWSPPWHAWSDEQSNRLIELAGTRDVSELAACLSREFGVPRTVAAVRIQAKRLSISLVRRGYTLRDLEKVFGADHKKIVKFWLEPGYLVGERCFQRGPHPGWLVSVASLERFVRDYAWAYGVRAMQPGHPMTQLALVAHRRDPWVTREQAAQWVGINKANFSKWLQRGLVPHRRRPGAGARQGHVMVRASDLPAIRDAIRAAGQAARQRTLDLFTERQHARRKAA